MDCLESGGGDVLQQISLFTCLWSLSIINLIIICPAAFKIIPNGCSPFTSYINFINFLIWQYLNTNKLIEFTLQMSFHSYISFTVLLSKWQAFFRLVQPKPYVLSLKSDFWYCLLHLIFSNYYSVFFYDSESPKVIIQRNIVWYFYSFGFILKNFERLYNFSKVSIIKLGR